MNRHLQTTTLSWPFGLLALALIAAPHGPLQAQTRSTSTQTPAALSCPALLNHSFPRLQDDKPQSLCQFSGKVLLVVNTASFCGYTPQYQGLEALHSKYASKGLVVLGFPSNDFNQESHDKAKIADVCFNTYGVKFPMFGTSAVRGKTANPLYAQLIQVTGKSPQWNFNKYLVGRDGKAVTHIGSATAPDSKELVAAIEKALGLN